ncbi:hypothetical protein GGR03_001203 [Aurantimonas endophytica]|uniref:Uncharacterized protein n=1 Tax=Aurantimonas endophytica TaxID=1522175 RepID=A0A7W6HBK9_9HYPH|nr:hypothetical protein [Aurantimonas endophytica]MBB4002156.1 hypothetical protein [Aurantimonas endophytica]
MSMPTSSTRIAACSKFIVPAVSGHAKHPPGKGERTVETYHGCEQDRRVSTGRAK